MLRIELHTDARAVAPTLASATGADPLGYTLLSTVHAEVASGARTYPGALWVVALDGDQAVGAAMRTPPHPLYVGPMPPEAATSIVDAVADELTTEGSDPAATLNGINGAEEPVRAAVARWQQRFPRVSVVGQVPIRLHRLGALKPPDVPGEPRAATEADLGLLLPWHEAFAIDVGHTAQGVEEMLRLRLGRGSMLVWSVAGEPVSMAGHTAVVAGVTRVGPVYTPPSQRGRGYGAAVTAATSAAARAQPGAREVTLFTDLRNPTSNKIYAQIGYEPVRDYLEVELTTAP
jgi:GNAT superfamily N-acetyltransferase